MSDIPEATKARMVAEMVEAVLEHKTRVIERTYGAIEAIMSEYGFPKTEHWGDWLYFLNEVSTQVAKPHDEIHQNIPEGPDDRARQRDGYRPPVRIQPLLPGLERQRKS